MDKNNNKTIIFVILIFFILISFIYYYYIEFYSQILRKSRIKDYTRWILCDKYVAKKYASLNGFKVAKTYQIVKYPHQIDFKLLRENININNNYVIKPVDLCDSHGIFIIKNNREIKNNNNIVNHKKIVNQLHKIRSNIFGEYYMHDKMFGGIIPFTGYIVEELLMDKKQEIPCDYKCYVFGGKIYFIAVTYNRSIKNNIQTFNSVWMTRSWNAIIIPMIKTGYKYQYLPRPNGYSKMINLVKKMAKKLERQCRIDVYLIDGEVYFGEFTFFTGATLHTFLCNMILGGLWLLNTDNYIHDPNIKKLVPGFYNKINLN